MLKRYFFIWIFGLSVSLAGQVPQHSLTPVPPVSKTPEQPPPDLAPVPSQTFTDGSGGNAHQRQDVVIGSGDLLTISVYDAPEYRYDVRVNSNGGISLPMIGAVHVAGMTIAEAEETISKQLQQKRNVQPTASLGLLKRILDPGDLRPG